MKVIDLLHDAGSLRLEEGIEYGLIDLSKPAGDIQPYLQGFVACMSRLLLKL